MARFKSKRSNACDITREVKRIVYNRDGGRCIFCGSVNAAPVCYIIPRSSGGLGVEQNIVTGCYECHNRLDNSTRRPEMLHYAVDYLKHFYPDWKRENYIYDRWRYLREQS